MVVKKPRVRAAKTTAQSKTGTTTSGTSRKSKTGSTTSSTSKTTSQRKKPSTTAGRAKTQAPKAAPRKKAAPKVVEPAVKRELNELGFMDGSDSATIARCLVEGGADRQDVNNRIIEAIDASTGITNRNGQEKYIPSMVSGILGRMLKTGKYEIQASWQLVPLEVEPPKKVARKRPAKK